MDVFKYIAEVCSGWLTHRYPGVIPEVIEVDGLAIAKLGSGTDFDYVLPYIWEDKVTSFDSIYVVIQTVDEFRSFRSEMVMSGHQTSEDQIALF